MLKQARAITRNGSQLGIRLDFNHGQSPAGRSVCAPYVVACASVHLNLGGDDTMYGFIRQLGSQSLRTKYVRRLNNIRNTARKGASMRKDVQIHIVYSREEVVA